MAMLVYIRWHKSPLRNACNRGEPALFRSRIWESMLLGKDFFLNNKLRGGGGFFSNAAAYMFVTCNIKEHTFFK